MESHTKRKIGIGLMLATGAAVAGWAMEAINQKEFVGSPFLWAVVLVLFYFGLYMTGASLDAFDKTQSAPMRRRMILIYLAFVGGLGLLFLSFHSATARHPMSPAQSYAPVLVLASLISYVPFYLRWVVKADISGRSALMVPILYFLGAIITPLAMIDIYNDLMEDVMQVNSPGDISGAPSNFVTIKNLVAEPPRFLEYTYHGNDRNKNHDVEFYGLVPVMTGRQDSFFDTWIEVTYKTSYPTSLADSTLERLERQFFANARQRIREFSIDSVVFFDHSKLDNRLVLRKNNYPLIDEALVIKPVYTSLRDYRGGQYNGYVFMWVLIAAFFWFGSAVKD